VRPRRPPHQERQEGSTEPCLSCSASAPYLGAPPAWVMSRGTTAFPRWSGTCNTSAGTPKGWQRFLTFAPAKERNHPGESASRQQRVKDSHLSTYS
jgi:hypothetical protein